jgi:hypothetical protein
MRDIAATITRAEAICFMFPFSIEINGLEVWQVSSVTSQAEQRARRERNQTGVMIDAGADRQSA